MGAWAVERGAGRLLVEAVHYFGRRGTLGLLDCLAPEVKDSERDDVANARYAVLSRSLG